MWKRSAPTIGWEEQNTWAMRCFGHGTARLTAACGATRCARSTRGPMTRLNTRPAGASATGTLSARSHPACARADLSVPGARTQVRGWNAPHELGDGAKYSLSMVRARHRARTPRARVPMRAQLPPARLSVRQRLRLECSLGRASMSSANRHADPAGRGATLAAPPTHARASAAPRAARRPNATQRACPSHIQTRAFARRARNAPRYAHVTSRAARAYAMRVCYARITRLLRVLVCALPRSQSARDRPACPAYVMHRAAHGCTPSYAHVLRVCYVAAEARSARVARATCVLRAHYAVAEARNVVRPCASFAQTLVTAEAAAEARAAAAAWQTPQRSSLSSGEFARIPSHRVPPALHTPRIAGAMGAYHLRVTHRVRGLCSSVSHSIV